MAGGLRLVDFVFHAPSLYDAQAEPDAAEGYLNAGLDFGARLARQKRAAVWLRERLIEAGVAPSSLAWDESGWAFSVDGKDGFALMILDSFGGGETPFSLMLAQIAGGEAEYKRADAALRAILRDRPEIERLEIQD